MYISLLQPIPQPFKKNYSKWSRLPPKVEITPFYGNIHTKKCRVTDTKLKKPNKTQKNPRKPNKTQKKPKKTQKNPPGWVFNKKPGFFPTLTHATILIREIGAPLKLHTGY
jgi:hypothetical protein